jgi:hypothetical protein
MGDIPPKHDVNIIIPKLNNNNNTPGINVTEYSRSYVLTENTPQLISTDGK